MIHKSKGEEYIVKVIDTTGNITNSKDIDVNISNEFPIEKNSWTIISPQTFIKEMDKSTFLHNGTGIPTDIRKFFNITNMNRGDKLKIELVYKDKQYFANIEMDKLSNPRTRIIWKEDFSELIRNQLPDWHEKFSSNDSVKENRPKMRLEKDNYNSYLYKVQFIDPDIIIKDIQSEIEYERSAKPEGSVEYYYSKMYERDHKNREKAIQMHGNICVVCGFDFEKIYGERGKGFIEIHHLKPLSTLDEEVVINPEEDLVPVCSNCHKIIHRDNANVLGIEDLKNILNMATKNELDH